MSGHPIDCLYEFAQWTIVWSKQFRAAHCVACCHWKVCNNCLIKIVQRCSPCGVLLLKKVYTVLRIGFYLALSSMAQRHAAFCERHFVLHERPVALFECHVALHVWQAAPLIFRQWNTSFNCCYVIFNAPRPLWLWKTPKSLMSSVHTYVAIPDNGLCT